MKHLLFIILVGFSQLVIAQSKLFTPGVVIANNGFQKINILNDDGSLYLKLYKTNEGEIKLNYLQLERNNSILNSIKAYYPFYYEQYKKYKAPLPQLSIRAFYPDYNIVVFDSKISNGQYKVFINGKWKTIKLEKSVSYQTWEAYLKNIYIKADNEHPLYQSNSEHSKVLSKDSNFSYKVIAVNGEWIKVKCSNECEGCVGNKAITGWIRWKNQNMILLNLYYEC